MILSLIMPTWALGRSRALPRLGQEYALQLAATDDGPVPELATELDAVATSLAPADRRSPPYPVRLRWRGLAIHYDSAAPLDGPVRLRVWLHDGAGFAHPDTPQVRGRVVRLRRLSTWMRWDEQRQAYVRPPDGGSRLDEVEQEPYLQLLDVANPEGEQTEFWEPEALVVDLEL